MLDSKALTKIQSVILISIIVVAAVGGVAYFLLSREEQTSDSIKIGVLVDLDATNGKKVWQGVLLAAEQLNAEGGILGKPVEVIGEDTDSESGTTNMAIISSALSRLIDYHEVDIVIGFAAGSHDGATCLEIIAERKKIFINVNGWEELSQRVLDNYGKYKYYFSTSWNESSVMLGMTDGLLLGREITGFNKIGFLSEPWAEGIVEGLVSVLQEASGFDVVYSDIVPYETVDFSSYFAATEAAGVEMLVPMIATPAGIPFIKEYYDRQSPMFIYGGIISGVATPESWEWTDGKCEHVTTSNTPIVAEYALTSKTLSTKDAYYSRWDESVDSTASNAFDILRYILSDAIERSGTIETEAVIKALEETNIETSNARNWAFTESHGLMMGVNPNDPEAAYAFVMYFQWQDGELVPVYPKKIMEDAGASYTFPDWPGPWDDIN